MKFSFASLFRTTACLTLALCVPLAAHAGPTGGVVVGGAATITTDGPDTVINQSTDRGIIRWNGFDVGQNESVQFRQPSASSITVNRVTGVSASQIDGLVKANGNIVIINPNGVVFGRDSRVDVGGLVATTSDLDSDSGFMAGGAMKFTKPGNANAHVTNNGSISVGEAGLAALVAPHVENNGVINAKMGKVALASGDVSYIDLAGDGLISVAVSDKVASQSVANNGAINADGGSVLITAAAARQLVDAVVTNSGSVEANSVGAQKGSVTISGNGTDNATGGSASGTVSVTGSVSAKGLNAGEAGGSIAVLGQDITIGSAATVDASGMAGGGSVTIGGAYQGGDSKPAATNVTVVQGAVLKADALDNGNGGSVVAWSNGAMDFHGTATAKGGANGGNGGSMEISGADALDFDGTVDLTAANGATGTLLLDPTDLVISSAPSQNTSGITTVSPSGDDVTSILNVTTLENALATSNVTVQTRASGSQPGDLTVAAPVSWASGANLTLTAANNIVVNDPIAGANLTLQPGNNLILNAGLSGTGSLTITPMNGQSLGIGSGQAGTLSLTDAEVNDFSAGGWNTITLGSTTDPSAFNLGAHGWSSNLNLDSGTGGLDINGAESIGNHNMNIASDGDVAIGGALSGGGHLTIAPVSASTSMSIATGTGTLDLSTSDLDNIAGGWNVVMLGNGSSTALMNVGAYGNWKDRIEFLNGTGGIDFTGVNNFNGNGMDIQAQANVTIGADMDNIGGFYVNQTDPTKTLGLGDAAGDLQLDQAELNHLHIENFFSAGYSNSAIAALNVSDAAFGNYMVTLRNIGAVNLGGTVASSYSGSASSVSMIVSDGHNASTSRMDFAAGTVLNPGTGRYEVISIDPSLDTYNGFVRSQKFYNASTYNPLSVSTGDIFAYTVAPVLTLTAQNASRDYGDPNPTFTYNVSGLIDGDTLGNALSSLGLATTANALSDPAAFAITAAPMLSAMGYQLGTVTGGTLTVSKATLNATAQDASRDYGDANPAFSVVYTGFKNGQDQSVIDMPATATSAAAPTTNAGTVVPIVASGASDNDYAFNYVNGNLTINKAVLDVQADNQTRAYGDANPPLTLSYSGFKNNETAGVLDTAPSASTAATQNSNVGDYAISATGGADHNYTFQYTDGILTVQPALVTVTAQPETIFPGGTPIFSVLYSGFELGEDQAVLTTFPLFTTTAPDYATPGHYTVDPYGAVAENYTFSYEPGLFKIHHHHSQPMQNIANNVNCVIEAASTKCDNIPPMVNDYAQIPQSLNPPGGIKTPIRVAKDVFDYYGLYMLDFHH
jgi:filamentous hemagglutinin family protein